MDRSKFLARVIGFYFISISLVMLSNMAGFYEHVQSLLSNEALLFVAGFFTLILGLIMLVSHNVWEWSWRLIITFVAWLVFLKGLYLILFPGMVDQMTNLFLHDKSFAYGVASSDLLLGLYLLYCGFKHPDAV